MPIMLSGEERLLGAQGQPDAEKAGLGHANTGLVGLLILQVKCLCHCFGGKVSGHQEEMS